MTVSPLSGFCSPLLSAGDEVVDIGGLPLASFGTGALLNQRLTQVSSEADLCNLRVRVKIIGFIIIRTG
eukprot:SAG25_NODE_47_length_18954_cov_11.266295_5_plen_69_part_00